MAREPSIYKPFYNGVNNEVQWIEISGSQNSIDELDLVRWLRLYGEILSPISEQAHKDSNPDCPVGNGLYLVKMTL